MKAATAIVLIISVVFLLFVGVISVVWPERIQKYALSHEGGWIPFCNYNPAKAFMHTRWYVWQLRLVGVMAIVMAAGVAMSLIRYCLGK